MRRKSSSVLTASMTIALCGAAAVTVPAVGQAADVSWDRLMNPEPENWLMYGGNLGGWRYSQLDQINRDNAGDLEVKYIFSILGESNSSDLGDREESVILADGGTLFVCDGLHRVYAFDATSGTRAVPLWMYDPALTKSRTCRGLALMDDGVFEATNDTRLIRVNSNTGEVVWETVATAQPIPEYGTPSADTQGFTTEPMVIRTAGGVNLVVQGESTGGQRGTISYAVAANADTGELAWRRYTIPLPGEPGHETWEDDHGAWKTGGAGIWSHGTFDPQTNLIYHGTGDIFPTYDPAFRPGDNLFGASTIALNADTGDIVWYHQIVPNESWDFDQPGTRMLYDGPDGTPLAAVFARSGHYYSYNRETGEIAGVFQYQTVNWTAGIDEKTGMPVDYDPSVGVQRYAGVSPVRGEQVGDSCPDWGASAMGLNPSSFDPVTRTAYLQFGEGCRGGAMLSRWPDEAAAMASNGLSRVGQSSGTSVQRGDPANPAVYTIAGYNVDTGERVAEYVNPDVDAVIATGTLNTAGGLVVAGTLNGDVQVLDAATLEPLYAFNVGAEIAAPFSTWSANGKQYIGGIMGGNGNGLIQQAAFGVVFGLRD